MAHEWSFFRAGGVDQVVIRTGADIAHLGELDQKLWVALACPTRGLQFDSRTLDLIDTNHDGRIRAPDLVAAAQWACARLKQPDDLVRGGDSLSLAALDSTSDAGAALAVEARRVLRLLGKAEATAIALADVLAGAQRLAAMRFDGDGAVAADASDDPAVAAVLRQIVDTQGPVQGRDGANGVSREMAERFFEQTAELRRWQQRADSDRALSPFGAGSCAAVDAVNAVTEKVNDFFARSRVAAYDARAAPLLNPSLDDYKLLAAQALNLNSPALGELPLAPVEAGASLPLEDGVNPYWAEALHRLQHHAVGPLLGNAVQRLGEHEWQQLQSRLAPCRDWLAARPTSALASALSQSSSDGICKFVMPLTSAETQAAVMALIAEGEAVAAQNALTADLEKLLRLQRDLLKLLHNFVSFAAFYHRQGAIFQAGTLFLDGRSCDLSVQVSDTARHALLAGMAKAYLAYCECSREGKTMNIVSAFTAGDVDFLFVGRNGIFYDRQGQDWDATITKVIENPTSIAQAFMSPYKKFLRLVEEQAAKRAAASENAAQTGFGSLAGGLAQIDQAALPGQGAAATAKRSSKVDVGAVAAMGVAFGSISAVMVGVFAKFIDLGWWIPVAIGGIVMAISGPSMLIAWLKLRQRSLGPILDASGWAVNGRMRVNVRLGASLSQTAHVPVDAERHSRDPFAERHGEAYLLTALALLLAVVLVGWRYELLNPLLPDPLQVHPAAPAPMVVVPARAASAPP